MSSMPLRCQMMSGMHAAASAGVTLDRSPLTAPVSSWGYTLNHFLLLLPEISLRLEMYANTITGASLSVRMADITQILFQDS